MVPFLDLFLWQTSFTFMIDERLTYYLIIELFTIALFAVVVLFYHDVVGFSFFLYLSVSITYQML